MNNTSKLILKLANEHTLSENEYRELTEGFDRNAAKLAAKYAREASEAVYGKRVFIRGLIEIGNICKNDCYYCGIRKSNRACDRYRLTTHEIIECAKEGAALGFKTFVLQGGEDAYFDDDTVCNIIHEIKKISPDAAVTLSLGERSFNSYKRLKEAGADRYLLREETADKEHYSKLHPESMHFDERIKCLYNLKSLGYQVGVGFMVGSPYQTSSHIASDLKFIEEFSPDMCGVGPFIVHSETPFCNMPSGDGELTCYLLSLIRLIKPNILLPATTALGTLTEGGRERGILSGANVIMPNLSPLSVRAKYALYDGKLSSGAESAQNLKELKERIAAIGYEIVHERGDIKII